MPHRLALGSTCRSDEDEIAAQYLEREYDVLLGGGRRHFMSEARDDEIDLLRGFRYTSNWILSELDEDSTHREIRDRAEEAAVCHHP